MADLEELIERVESGTGADRTVDGEVFIALSPECQAAGRVDHLQGVVGWWPKDGPYESARNVPCYTASLDAVLALIEEKLPGAAFVVHGPDDGWFFGGIGPCLGEAWGDDCSATSPARALLAAALRALKESRHVG